MKQQIIDTFLSKEIYKTWCKQRNYQLHDDLYQELCLAILNQSEQKLIEITKGGYFDMFVYRMIRNIDCNKTRKQSSLYQLSNYSGDANELKEKDNKTIREECWSVLEELIEKYKDAPRPTRQKAKSELYWYDIRLIQEYAKEGSSRKLSEATGIPHVSIWVSLQKIKKAINKLK